MSNATASSRASGISDEKQTLLNDIGQMWFDFSSKDLSNLKSSDDLATQVAARYGIDKAKAEKEVAAVLKGRTL